MLKFKIFEIPEERSEKIVEIGSDELDLDDITFQNCSVHIEFYRTNQFVRTQFTIDGTVELICDRSLDAFDYSVRQDYEVLFKAEEVDESADENGAIRNYDHANQAIDLEPDIRDTILLNLPTKKLHPRFLDEEGNPKEILNEQFGDISEDDEDQIDPRWEKLKELKR